MAAHLTPSAPGGFEDYLRELAIGLQRGRSEDETFARRKRFGEAYDITVIGPPPHR
jgi:hypothetical protein